MTNARDKANIPVLNFQSKGIDDNADATAITIDSSERVGIGESSPISELHITDASATAVVRLESSDSGDCRINFDDQSATDRGRIIYAHSDDSLRTEVAGSERLRITSTGLVGIGETAPLGNLHVKVSDSGVTSLNSAASGLFIESANSTGMTIASGTSNVGRLVFADSGSNLIGYVQYDHANNSMSFQANGAERMTLTSTGLGIGETTPLTKLHVKTADSGVTPFANADEMLVEGSTHSGITIGSGTSGTGNIYFGDSADNDVGRITYDHSADRLDFRTNTESGFFMQTMTGVTITSSYANMLTVPFGGYLIEIGSSANNASREVWLVLRNGAAYSAATTRLLQRTGNDGPRTYNIRVPADGILEAKLDSGSTITDAKISLFKFGM